MKKTYSTTNIPMFRYEVKNPDAVKLPVVKTSNPAFCVRGDSKYQSVGG